MTIPQSQITVAYEEVAGSPTSDNWSLENNGTHTGTRQFRVNWNDRRKFIQQALGVYNPNQPMLPINFPGMQFSRAASCACQPESTLICPTGGLIVTYSNMPNDDSPTYEKALITVNYSSRYNTNALIDESLEPSAQFLTLDNNTLFWDSGGTTTPLDGVEVPQKIIRMVDWNVTLYNLRSLPTGLISMMGNTNNAAITSATLGCTFAQGTLLFLGGQPSRTFLAQDASGLTAPFWKLNMKFTAKQYDWNLFYRRGDPTPQAIYKASGGGQFLPYTQSDFVAGLNVNGSN